MKIFTAKKMTVCSVVGGVMLPSISWACACGCGIFDVGTSSMLPSGSGGTFYLDYGYQDQNHNWNGTSQAPSANNDDHRIQTHFITAGVQYMFNRSWGARVDIPYENRNFSAEGAAPINFDGLGDIRIKGIYSGFSEDMSSGITFGLKLPSGSYTFHSDTVDVDRDTQLGTGSTDLLLGGFYRHNFMSLPAWSWFAQTELVLPVATQDEFRPGTELNLASGFYYQRWSIGNVEITPVAQSIFTERTSDGGANAAHPTGSGYQRLLLSPGIEFKMHPISVYADVELPVYQNFNGNQLAAPYLVKVSVSYHF